MASKKISQNYWSIEIDRLTSWLGNSWSKSVPIKNLRMVVHNDQIIISDGNKIFETISLVRKIKGFFKDDILILVFNQLDGVRKVKFQIKSDVEECIDKLMKYFVVVCHNRPAAQDATRFDNIQTVMKAALEGNDSTEPLLPEDFKNFVKLCLLDPAFPQYIRETQNIIENI